MTKHNDVIELNGKRYHALTGAFLGDFEQGGGRIRQADSSPRHHTMPATPSVRRQPGSHLPAHKPQPTRTLMRRAVAQSQAATPQPLVKPQAPLKAAQLQPQAVRPKSTASAVDLHRSRRAVGIDRSRLVKHFQANDFTTVSKPVPKPLTMQVHKPQPAVATVHTDLSNAAHRQPTYNAKPAAAKPAVTSNQASATRQALAVRRPQMRRPAIQQAAIVQHKLADKDEQDIFERALAMATAHEQQPPKQTLMQAAKRRKRTRRVLSLASGLAVFVLLAGFIAYQNKASIQLQMASAKAGFAASEPVYKPSGYSMGKLAYEPGTVTAMYNNQGGKSFSIVQKKSNWDSQTLLENFVSTSNEEYQGYESNGRTIYLYGNGKATWVDGGIWYQINAGNTLPTDQLVKVAASM